mgnify:CR=1 FL=1
MLFRSENKPKNAGGRLSAASKHRSERRAHLVFLPAFLADFLAFFAFFAAFFAAFFFAAIVGSLAGLRSWSRSEAAAGVTELLPCGVIHRSATKEK